jgi:hypothetical protein
MQKSLPGARIIAEGNGRRRSMNDELLEQVAGEVLEWQGVTTGDTGRGGLQFSYGRVELGHLHGSSFADLPFPKKVRDELIEEGRATVHPPLPDSGWVRRRMDGPEDAQAVIELFRMNYDRAKARAERRATSENE